MDRPDTTDGAASPHGDPAPTGGERAAEAGNLRALADAAETATWRETTASRGVVPGVISGDVGPKGRVSAQLRDLSRGERATYGEVPRGGSDGSFWLVLVPMLGIGITLLALVGLVVWLAR